MKKYLLSILCVSILMQHSLFSQNPSLVKDLNTIATTSEVAQLAITPSNGKIYFSAFNYATNDFSLWTTNDTVTTKLKGGFTNLYFNLGHPRYAELNGKLVFTGTTLDQGQELWISDGTASGTHIIKDIVAGLHDGVSNSGVFVSALGYVFFFSGTSSLWKTDGTNTGTVKVKDLPGAPLISGSFEFNGKLFFQGSSYSTYGTELWITDGTTSGTGLLKDINPGANGSNPSGLTVFNNTLYFIAASTSGDGLWMTDGTSTGTVLVKDFDPNSTTIWNTSYPYSGYPWMIIMNGKLFFTAHTNTNGNEVWCSDGTESGTNMLVDVYPGTSSSNPERYTALGNQLMFTATDSAHGKEYWLTDGTNSGTHLLKDINQGINGSVPYLGFTGAIIMTSVNNKIFFSTDDGIHGVEPWITDGTSSGTVLLKDIYNGSGGAFSALFFQQFGNTGLAEFTSYNDSCSCSQLLVSDGTTSGTIRISSNDSNFPSLVGGVLVANKLYFGPTSDPGHLWASDGTIAGTHQIIFDKGTESSYPTPLVKIEEGKYVFSARENDSTIAIYLTDGTSNGTSITKEFGDNSAVSFAPSNANGKAFFEVVNYESFQEWCTDGTTSGTIQLDTIASLFSYGTTVAHNIFFFPGDFDNCFCDDGAEMRQLYRSDGTVNGTFKVTNFSGSSYDHLQKIMRLGNEVMFFINGSTGIELWKSDGSMNGTTLVKLFSGHYSNTYSSDYAELNGRIYFSQTDAVNGTEVWVSDGTETGTQLLKDIYPGTSSSNPNSFKVSGENLFFQAYAGASTGAELWKTDGTSSGTVMVKDIYAGSNSSSPKYLTSLNDTLYFTASTPQGNALWKSDGTATGTLKVYNFGPTILGTVVMKIFISSSNLYLVTEQNLVNNTYVFNGLWRSDGTACRTQKLELDSVFINTEVSPSPFLLADDHLIFLLAATNYSGKELYKYVTTPIVSYEVCNGFDDDCNGIIDDGAVASINPSTSISICKNQPFTFITDDGTGLNYQWKKNGNNISGATRISYTTGKNEGGNFSVNVSRTGGCNVTSPATTLSRYNLPAANITPLGNLEICQSGSVDLQANDGTDFTYQWIKNNSDIAGATNSIFTAFKKGSYKVVVTNMNECSKTSKATKVTKSCREENHQLVSADELLVYPNPSSGIFSIQFLSSKGTEVVTINLYDVLGRNIFSVRGSSTDSAQTIDLPASILNGEYLMEVASGTAIRQIKIIIQR